MNAWRRAADLLDPSCGEDVDGALMAKGAGCEPGAIGPRPSG